MARKPKTVYERNRRDAKQLLRDAKVGDVYYTIMNMSEVHMENLGGHLDPQYYSAYIVTHMHQIFGGAMFGGSCSADQLVLNSGPVYSEPPANMAGIHEVRKDIFHPYGGDNNRVMPLNAASARDLAQLAADIRNR